MLRQSREAAAAVNSPVAQPGNVLPEVACRLSRGILAAHIFKQGPHGPLMRQGPASVALIPCLVLGADPASMSLRLHMTEVKIITSN